MKVLLVCVCLVFVTACSWVKLTEEGEKSRVLTEADVVNCKKLGTTTVSLKASVAGFDRSAKKVKMELETLARNRASDINGDTVVPLSAIENGQQTFSVYRCINP